MFSENLKATRKEKGITQLQLASALNVANGTVAMWETGKREPDLKTIRRIAEVLEVTTSYLIGENEKKPTPVSGDGLTEDQKEWSNAWDQASPELRRAAMAVLRSGGPAREAPGDSPSGT